MALSATDIEPVAHESRDQIITGTVTVVPLLALAFAAWQAWESLLRPGDVVVFAVFYVLTGLGVTVGFHRHLTHRSFKTKRPIRALLAILGSAAIEGAVISWVADHRKHHAFSDRAGDPHSPHVDHGDGWRGALRGLAHAHVGWLFRHDQRGAHARATPPICSRTRRSAWSTARSCCGRSRDWRCRCYLQSPLHRDLVRSLHDDNFDREHHGRITNGRHPADLVCADRKMEPR
jgi:fatty-acid desaturase